MRWILYVLIFLVLLVLAGFLFPREVTLERSVYISRPPEVVFPYVDDFRNFNSWSPWQELDPDTQYRYSGPREGVGAVMSWHSDNPSVGSGSQTITSSQAYSLVHSELDFDNRGKASVEFRLQPQGSGTNVTWWFHRDMGPGPIDRWMGLLVKRRLGQSYETGLNRLKSLVESVEMPQAEPKMDNGSSPELPSEEDDGMGVDPGDMDPGGTEDETLEEEGEEPTEEYR